MSFDDIPTLIAALAGATARAQMMYARPTDEFALQQAISDAAALADRLRGALMPAGAWQPSASVAELLKRAA